MLIKLLPCVILTLISFVLIRVLYKASKRKIKLKGYSYQPSNEGMAAALTSNGSKKLVTINSLVLVEMKMGIVAIFYDYNNCNYYLNISHIPFKPPELRAQTDELTELPCCSWPCSCSS